jgi:hypothetical protein
VAPRSTPSIRTRAPPGAVAIEMLTADWNRSATNLRSKSLRSLSGSVVA